MFDDESAMPCVKYVIFLIRLVLRDEYDDDADGDGDEDEDAKDDDDTNVGTMADVAVDSCGIDDDDDSDDARTKLNWRVSSMPIVDVDGSADMRDDCDPMDCVDVECWMTLSDDEFGIDEDGVTMFGMLLVPP